jgi:hypothetical protein
MGLYGCWLSDTHIPDLVAIRLLRRYLRSELRQGRGLVHHMASILVRFHQGISLKCPAMLTFLLTARCRGPHSEGARSAGGTPLDLDAHLWHQTEPASIRSVSRQKVLVMASSVSSSHTHSCTGVANGSDLPGSKPKERMKPRDDCGTSAVSILRVA